jgi:hypothetical protein
MDILKYYLSDCMNLIVAIIITLKQILPVDQNGTS